jgi:hypothetical protein
MIMEVMTTATDSTSLAVDAKGEESTRIEESPGGPPWWLFSVFLGVSTLAIVVYGWSVASAPLILIEVLVGVGSAAVGGLLGFLFGMPRASVAPATREGDSATDAGVGYQPSTNLEQVSDWLTKILIGVGLVELSQLGDTLAAMGRVVESSLKEAPPGTVVVTQAVIVGLLVLGFLASFLWTRIYYGPLQAVGDAAVVARLRNVLAAYKRQLTEEKTSRQAAEEVASKLAKGEVVTQLTMPSAQASTERLAATNEWKNWEPSVVERIEKLSNAPADWDSDPIPDLFPEAKREANGRRLEASLLHTLKDGLTVLLRVRKVGNQPLTGTVVFLLHPTFPDPILSEMAVNNKAEISIYTEGWSTVAAIADGGKTILSYDLRDLPGAPDWFKEN